MKKVYFVQVLTVILSAVMIFGSFALYTMTAEEKTVSIRFGEIVELSIANEAEAETSVITPDTAGSVTVSLKTEKVSEDSNADEYTYGKFYVEVTGEEGVTLTDVIQISAEVEGKSYSHDEIVKSGSSEPEGIVLELNDETPYTLKLSYSLTEEGKENFIDYAEQSIKLKLHWNFCEAPVNDITIHVQGRTSDYGSTLTYKVTNSDGTTSDGSIAFDNTGSYVDIAVAEGAKQISFWLESEDTNVNTYDLSSYSATEFWIKLSGSNDDVYTTNPDAS